MLNGEKKEITTTGKSMKNCKGVFMLLYDVIVIGEDSIHFNR